MSILQRLPNSSIYLNKFRHVISVNGVKASAAYSICCVNRTHSFEKSTHNPKLLVNPVSFHLISKRNKSFSEVFSQIYVDISHSATVSYFQNALISFHDFTGLPWWATIIVYTFGLRLVTFPLAAYAQQMRAKLHCILQEELPPINVELKKEVAIAKKQMELSDRDAYFLYKRSFNTQYRKLIERDNCHPLKTTILFWFQIPIWVCHSIGIRNILTMQPDPTSEAALITYTQMTSDGFLWIPNLLEADTTYILPVIWCITNLMNIELGALERVGVSSKFMTTITAIFRLVIVAVVPIAATVPSCLTLYWCTSSLCALGQNLVLLSPNAKRILGIPIITKFHMDRPYRTLAQRFVEQMGQRKDWCISFIKTK